MKFKENMENIGPKWVRPNIKKEKGEIERVVREFLNKGTDPNVILQVSNILETSPFVELSDDLWGKLENTDSFENVRPGHIEDADRITEKYNQELALENKRHFKTLLDSFLQEKEMESPTILKNEKGKLHLVSGNTRLMIARALKIRPKVVIGEYK